MQRTLRVGLLLLSMGFVPAGWTAERVALVIGNAQYLNERPLVNTLNDAQAMANQLRGLGFQVALHEDLAAIPMRREINRFLEEVRGREGTVLFYYSGHGIQDHYRASYLLPVDAKVTGQEDVVAYGVSLNDILVKLGERPRDAVSLVIVDACRDNPFSTQRGGKGLGRVEAGRGTLVLYAAGPGQTADDRPGEPNGLFTQHLLKVLPQPGLDLEDAFDRIAEAVEHASNGHQVPYKEGDLRGKYYLAGAPTPIPTPIPAPTPAPVPTPSDEHALWQSAERCGTAACFQAYLKKYPNGQFAEIARARLQPTPTPTPIPAPTPAPTPTPSDEQVFWQSAERCGTAACFQAYLKKYPNGRFAEMAQARLQPPPTPAVPGSSPPTNRLASESEFRSDFSTPPSSPPVVIGSRAVDENRPKDLNAQGESAYRAGRYDEAIRLYQAAIDLNGNYAQAYSNLGLVFRKTKRMSEALWAGRKAIELASGPSAAVTRASSYYNNGKVYEEIGQYNNALREYEYARREKNNPVYDQAILRMQQRGAR